MTGAPTTPPRPPQPTESSAANGPGGVRTIAVVVTRFRAALLLRSLEVICAQSAPVDGLVVVDNGNEPEVAEAVHRLGSDHGISVRVISSQRNLGGAGGFALGMLHALAWGAERVWLADDDGYPGGPTTLEHLHRELDTRGLGMVSPLVVDIEDASRLAFPTRRGGRRVTLARDLVGPSGFAESFAALFNGALFTAETLDRVGVPDHRLFIRGDEIEIDRRLKRSGVPFGTTGSATYLHPSGAEEFQGALNVGIPSADFKSYYTFRNRGYLTNQPGKRLKGIAEYGVYAVHFAVRRRSLRELREWFALMREGRAERFDRFEQSQQPEPPDSSR
ncbi:glycosyltransferase [Micrococcales bacterium 31B]|nr:glycosyltransferase [Micrococcales bacterium 31B]